MKITVVATYNGHPINVVLESESDDDGRGLLLIRDFLKPILPERKAQMMWEEGDHDNLESVILIRSDVP